MIFCLWYLFLLNLPFTITEHLLNNLFCAFVHYDFCVLYHFFLFSDSLFFSNTLVTYVCCYPCWILSYLECSKCNIYGCLKNFLHPPFFVVEYLSKYVILIILMTLDLSSFIIKAILHYRNLEILTFILIENLLFIKSIKWVIYWFHKALFQRIIFRIYLFKNHDI